MIRILIAESSHIIRTALGNILNADPMFTVCASVSDGAEALQKVRTAPPDVIITELYLPKLSGLELIDEVMTNSPIPIIVLSHEESLTSTTDNKRALAAGAVTILVNPVASANTGQNQIQSELKNTIKAIAGIRLLKRTKYKRIKPVKAELSTFIARKKAEVVLIGASAGGPPVIQKLLSLIPQGFRVPIIIVQHISAGFTEGFINWLNQSSHVPVKIAADGEPLCAGTCYFAPDDFHLIFKNRHTLSYCNSAEKYGSKPSIGVLLESYLPYCSEATIAILLSGMGKDGASELKLLNDKGAITIAQDFETALINGIPGEAVKLQAAKYIFSPEQMIEYLSGIDYLSESMP